MSASETINKGKFIFTSKGRLSLETSLTRTSHTELTRAMSHEDVLGVHFAKYAPEITLSNGVYFNCDWRQTNDTAALDEIIRNILQIKPSVIVINNPVCTERLKSKSKTLKAYKNHITHLYFGYWYIRDMLCRYASKNAATVYAVDENFWFSSCCACGKPYTSMVVEASKGCSCGVDYELSCAKDLVLTYYLTDK